MYLTRGIYASSYRPVPAAKAKAATHQENRERQVPQTEPFMFTRLFLVLGILMAGIALATFVSA